MKRLLLALLVASPAAAQHIDTGPPGGFIGRFIGRDFGDQYSVGQTFTALGHLDQFSFALKNLQNFQNVHYRPFISQTVGGAHLWSNLATGTTNTTYQDATFAPKLDLIPGQEYFAGLMFETARIPLPAWGVAGETTGDTYAGGQAYIHYGGTWHTTGGDISFRAQFNSVPEPGTVLLVAGGLLALMLHRATKKVLS